MAEQKSQGKYTDIILDEVARGRETIENLIERKAFWAEREATDDHLYTSTCEALTILQPQQSQQS